MSDVEFENFKNFYNEHQPDVYKKKLEEKRRASLNAYEEVLTGAGGSVPLFDDNTAYVDKVKKIKELIQEKKTSHNESDINTALLFLQGLTPEKLAKDEADKVILSRWKTQKSREYHKKYPISSAVRDFFGYGPF